MDNKEYFLLGYWNDPYRPYKEYFWMRGFDSKAEALQTGKRKQEKGQPKQFIDWVKGANRVFDSEEKFLVAAKKAGLNPAL